MVMLTELPWRLGLSAGGPGLAGVDVVQAGLVHGIQAVEGLRRHGQMVGAVLLCPEHRRLHVPVERDTRHRWGLPQTDCTPGDLGCGRPGECAGRRRCPGALWLSCPEGAQAALTDSRALHHALALVRSRRGSAW